MVLLARNCKANVFLRYPANRIVVIMRKAILSQDKKNKAFAI